MFLPGSTASHDPKPSDAASLLLGLLTYLRWQRRADRQSPGIAAFARLSCAKGRPWTASGRNPMHRLSRRACNNNRMSERARSENENGGQTRMRIKNLSHRRHSSLAAPRTLVAKLTTQLEFSSSCGYVAFRATEKAMRSIRSYIAAPTAAAPSFDRRADWRHMRSCAALRGLLGTSRPETGLRKPD